MNWISLAVSTMTRPSHRRDRHTIHIAVMAVIDVTAVIAVIAVIDVINYTYNYCCYYDNHDWLVTGTIYES